MQMLSKALVCLPFNGHDVVNVNKSFSLSTTFKNFQQSKGGNLLSAR